MTDHADTDHRAGFAAARRLYLHYQTAGQPAVADDLARVTAWYERACDEIDRLRAARLPSGD
ncbi:hypothetical protein [Azospirillum sp. SYSU D00513]|uniref:hypothetical protein n=1 Tax=Azospirillum sp. SYSU D00513 TaxID=2812561 RepID=UPI001A971B68|nr:hypothetical protein [Azospirillum sp. SYSU D00513]